MIVCPDCGTMGSEETSRSPSGTVSKARCGCGVVRVTRQSLDAGLRFFTVGLVCPSGQIAMSVRTARTVVGDFEETEGRTVLRAGYPAKEFAVDGDERVRALESFLKHSAVLRVLAS